MNQAHEEIGKSGSNVKAFLVSVIFHLCLFIVLAVWAMPASLPPHVLTLNVDDSRLDQAPVENLLFTPTITVPDPPEQEQASESSPPLELLSTLNEVPELQWVVPPAMGVGNPTQRSGGGDGASLLTGLSRLASPADANTQRPAKFEDLIRDAQTYGIDIVMVFDSTSSMAPEIVQVKRRLLAIGEMIQDKIPEARFSLVTYRDHGDEYLVNGIPLDKDLSKAQDFVFRVRAAGGGNFPESVLAGMQWAMRFNDFSRYRQKAMLIFGDAPPHGQDIMPCIRLAREFHEMGKARVSTITCRQRTPIPAFYQIARAGGGDAYILYNTRRLMVELLVSAFGQEHRQQVLRFFEVDG